MTFVRSVAVSNNLVVMFSLPLCCVCYCIQVFPAKEVYLYMGSRSSVSRNARTTWCMKYFNKVLPSRTKEEEVG